MENERINDLNQMTEKLNRELEKKRKKKKPKKVVIHIDADVKNADWPKKTNDLIDY